MAIKGVMMKRCYSQNHSISFKHLKNLVLGEIGAVIGSIEISCNSLRSMNHKFSSFISTLLTCLIAAEAKE